VIGGVARPAGWGGRQLIEESPSPVVDQVGVSAASVLDSFTPAGRLRVNCGRSTHDLGKGAFSALKQ